MLSVAHHEDLDAAVLLLALGLVAVEQAEDVAATEGLGQDAVAAEIAYRGIISGTYPLASLALVSAQIAQHAEQTAEAVEEVLR